VILVHGNHNEIVTSQRGKRGLASDINTEIRTDIRKNVAEIGTVTGDKNEVAIQQSFAPQQSTLRAKRGLAADINTEIRTDIRKNVATIGTVTGDKNEVAIKQS
jgi:ribosomal protein L29